MAINWEMILEGYNDRYETSFSEREMWQDLYPRYSCFAIAEILMIDSITVLHRIRHNGISIQSKGWRHPTKWDKLCRIPINVLTALPISEIADIIDGKRELASFYRTIRLQQLGISEGRGGQAFG